MNRTGPPQRSAGRQRGQSLTEYVVILALLIVAAVVGLTIYRGQMVSQVRATSEALRTAGLSEPEPTARAAVPRAADRRPDRTARLPPPSIFERLLSRPESILLVLFVLFVCIVLLLRSLRKRAERQRAEELRRLEEARSHFRRDAAEFSGQDAPQDLDGPSVL